MRLLFAECAIDTERRELRRAGELVHVEPQVFDLIVFLIRYRDRVVTKDQLLEAVWQGRVVSDSALSTRINAARQAIGDSGELQKFIQTLARRGFRFVANVEEDVSAEEAASGSPSKTAQPGATPAASERPAIAVLPFDNQGGAPDESYFAEGMADALITSLSHIRWLTVIARSSSFALKGRGLDTRRIGGELNVRYLLDGGVRRAHGRVRVMAELIEAETGRHLWGDKFDGQVEEIFDFQDRITASVIGAIEPSLRGAEIARAERKRPENLGAYDLYLRALPHAYAYTREGRSLALKLLGNALAMDPIYAEAHGLAAWCHIQRIWTEAPDLKTDLSSAVAHARAVMAIRTDDASTLAFAANAYARAAHDYETALQMIEHALARNPSNAHALAVGAVVNAWAGRWKHAIGLAERALRCSPFDPTRHLALAATARARLFEGNAEAALVAARGAVHASPGHLPSHGYVLICLVRLARTQELAIALERMRASFPDIRTVHFLAHATFEPFSAELRALGLPD
jgi:TolB-like protein